MALAETGCWVKFNPPARAGPQIDLPLCPDSSLQAPWAFKGLREQSRSTSGVGESNAVLTPLTTPASSSGRQARPERTGNEVVSWQLRDPRPDQP